MVNTFWPTPMAGKADSVSSVSASACHIGWLNCVNPGQILLVYGTILPEKNTFQLTLQPFFSKKRSVSKERENIPHNLSKRFYLLITITIFASFLTMLSSSQHWRSTFYGKINNCLIFLLHSQLCNRTIICCHFQRKICDIPPIQKYAFQLNFASLVCQEKKHVKEM